MAKAQAVVPIERIASRIYLIRGEKVMFDTDLAELYDVPTKRLNEQVTRNLDRFPADFMFQLSQDDRDSLRRHFGTLKRGQHAKYLPYVFTVVFDAIRALVAEPEPKEKKIGFLARETRAAYC